MARCLGITFQPRSTFDSDSTIFDQHPLLIVPTDEPMPPLPSRDVLEAMKRVDLQRLCKDYGVKANLKSEALIDLLLDTQSVSTVSTSRHPLKHPLGRLDNLLEDLSLPVTQVEQAPAVFPQSSYTTQMMNKTMIRNWKKMTLYRQSNSHHLHLLELEKGRSSRRG